MSWFLKEKQMKKILCLLSICIIAAAIVMADETSGEQLTHEGQSVAGMNAKVKTFITKDGENTVNVTFDQVNMAAYPTIAQNEKWQWYTPDEFEYVIMVALNPTKAKGYYRDPEYGSYDFLMSSMSISAERDKAILQQTLNDIKKGIKVSKPIYISITSDGLNPTMTRATTNIVGWAHWYAYSYSFKDKTGKEVDLGIYETRDGLFNALRYYCEKEVKGERMTKREADKLYKGIAHTIRNCDEVPLSDKLVNFRKLYNPYRFK